MMEHDAREPEPLDIREFLAGPEFHEPLPGGPVYAPVRSGQFTDPADRQPVTIEIPRRVKRLALFLFVATCISTLVAGMMPGGGPMGGIVFFQRLLAGAGFEQLAPLVYNGLAYAGALMLILLFHEMGHYLQARRYGIPATPPLFIPFPITPFGTLGAVIVQGAGVADRKALFDVAISGPLAGLVVALPVAFLGVWQSEFQVVDPEAVGIIYQDPLVLKWMIDYIHPNRPEGAEVLPNPLLFAGWVGIFITALNLLPIGQLDGGHILYTLIGRRAHVVAYLLLMAAIVFMVLARYPAYGLMVILLFLMGPKHPPTADDYVPLGPTRVALGWLTLAFIVIGFTPTPIL